MPSDVSACSSSLASFILLFAALYTHSLPLSIFILLPVMRVQNCHIVGAFLLPLTVGATNSSSVKGLLSSNNGKLLMIINRGVDADFFHQLTSGLGLPLTAKLKLSLRSSQMKTSST